MLPSIHRLLLILCLAGDGSTVDKVVLRTGGIVEGTIVAEDEKRVAIEVASGGRIEVPMSAVKTITRATERPASAPASKPAAAAAVPITPRMSFAVVRNAAGEYVGTRQLQIGPDPELPACVRIEEQCQLLDEDGKPIKVIRVEVADTQLRPKEAFYREVFGASASSVRATIAGDRIEVDAQSDSGRTRESLLAVPGLTFPLLLEEKLRTAPPEPGQSIDALVYDPFARTIAQRTVRGEDPRKLAIGEETPAPHRVYVSKWRGIESSTWLQASGEVARAELNGPDLVAIRCTAEEAAQVGAATAEPAVARDPEGRVRVLLPGPSWRVERAAAEGILLARRDGSASMAAIPLDVEAEVTASGATLVLERRLKQTMDGYERVGSVAETRVANLPATRVDFTYMPTGQGKHAGRAVIVRGREACWVFIATFEAKDRGVGERDLDRVLTRAEVRL